MPRQRTGLSTLFPSVGTSRFLERYSSRRPVWSHRSPKRLGRLAELQQIGNIVQLAVRSRMQMKAMMRGTHHEANEIPVDADSVLSLYDAGATIACNDLHRWHKPAADWTRRLTRELRAPDDAGGCNLYISPAGTGVGMHFDDHEIIVVQLAGRKRWTYAVNRTVSNPTTNSGRQLVREVARYATGSSPKGMPPGKTVDLVPGSVLFLPRGYWHATIARESSVSLTFGFRTPKWVDLLLEYLESRLIENVDWREPAWHAWDRGPTRRLAEQHWRRLCAGLPDGVRSVSLADLIAARRG